jgi:triphosphatase
MRCAKFLTKLRYSVEFLAPIGKKWRVKAYLRGCKSLQQHLGLMNDTVVAVALSERLGRGRQAELA